MSHPLLEFPQAVVFECWIFLLVFAAWRMWPDLGKEAASHVRYALASIARRPFISLLAPSLLAIAGAVLTAGARGLPEPLIHDEFSYLLAAATFNGGELAAPAHPLWEHFESFHVLQQPVHASKYPPGQGVILAAGTRLGHPIWGVWAITGLACGAVSWMLRAYLPSYWALSGGLLAALVLGFFSDWTQSYWGGSLAALGGTLLFGALARLQSRPSARHGAIGGLGTAILMFSRPFEGAITVALTAAALAWRRSATPGKPYLPPIAAGILVLAAAVFAGGYYNWRVVGNAMQMPYAVYEAQYKFVPLFLFLPPAESRTYRHAAFRQFQEWGRREHALKRTPGGFVARKSLEVFFTWQTFGKTVLLLPFVLGALTRSRSFGWSTAAVTGGVFLVVLLQTWTSSRKLAPVFPLVILFTIVGLRRLRAARRASRSGSAAYKAALVAVLISSLIGFLGRFVTPKQGLGRPAVERTLLDTPGEHLVFVRYEEHHNPHHEWVYNEPHFDSARIVWARELSLERDCQLISYYSDRHAWLVEPDSHPIAVQPYPDGCF